MEITKPLFNTLLPAAISAQAEVFDKCLPLIQRTQQALLQDTLGTTAAALVDDATYSRHVQLSHAFAATACVQGFLSALSQLDLVLTATGFGVVSNNSVAPASQQRVAALTDNLRQDLLRHRSRLITELTVIDGWADTPQAGQTLQPSPFYDFNYFTARNHDTTKPLQGWADYQQAAARQWNAATARYGHGLTSPLRHAIAADITTADPLIQAVATDLRDITWADYQHQPLQPLQRIMYNDVEAAIDLFPLYKASSYYQRNHATRFQNTKDSPAYIFK